MFAQHIGRITFSGYKVEVKDLSGDGLSYLVEGQRGVSFIQLGLGDCPAVNDGSIVAEQVGFPNWNSLVP